MKVSEFIGMKVLNKEANEIGKVADLAINLHECLVDKIVIVEGGALKKKYFGITENDISEIGDYVQLKFSQADMDKILKFDKIEDLMKGEFNYKEFIGKPIISADAMNVGKIENMVIDPKKCIVHNIIISTGGTFNKKHMMISYNDIKHIGDYIMLKSFKDDLEQKIVD